MKVRRAPAPEIVAAFARLVQRDADAPLVIAAKRRHTLGDVDALAADVQAQLEELGAAGQGVGLRAANGAGFLAALLAIWRAGGTAVLVDADARSAERGAIASELGIRTWVRCAALDGSDVAIEHTREGAGPIDFDAASVVKLTSGTAGRPRGILVSEESLLADDAALTRTMGIHDRDRLFTTVPFAHSYGFSSLVLPALLRGVPLLVADTGGCGVMDLAREAAGSVLFTVPSFLDGLLSDPSRTSLPDSLRLVVSAGAPLDADTATRFRERFGQSAHGFYGASECGGICYDGTGGAAERGTVGPPVEGVEVGLEPQGDDGAGSRVVVRSPAVARGYVPGAGQLAGRFVTEDLAEWRGGELALLGRVGPRINIRGFKVDPREVERAIAALPEVDEVHVVGVPDARGRLLLRAVVACRAGALRVEDVLDACRSRLVPHKVPRSVALVEAIRKTGRGKVDRDWLMTVSRGGRAPEAG